MFAGKKVVVLGAARSGISAAEILLGLGAEVTLTDSTPLHKMPESDQVRLKGLDIRLVTGSHPEVLLDRVDFIVKNPGISPKIPFLEAAKSRGIRWISELELAGLITQAEIVAITGTNGKTTTTTLAGEIFSHGKRPSVVGGNIGLPLTSVSFRKGPEWVLIVETSSFQLEDCYELRPKVAVYTNITPDHLDRHGSMDEYIRAKLRLVQNQTEDDYVIINLDDPIVSGLDYGRGKRIGYSLSGNNGAECYIQDGWFWWQDTKIAPIDTLKILGAHNQQNALAAIAAGMVMGLDGEEVLRALSVFTGVEHRLEYVGDYSGIRFYNDSKATNPDSTIIALNSFPEKVILLAGGSDKGADFAQLAPLFKEKVKQIFAFGHTGEKMRGQVVRGGFESITAVSDLPAAFDGAMEVAQAGDIILLSPACASWDQYPNFEERGRHFKNLVKNLGG